MDSVFQGFDPTKEMAIPGDLVDHLLQEIRSLSELKVTLFIIRHTFSQNISLKCLSLNDFVVGVKDEQGRVVGSPVGLAKQHILSGIALAEKRKTILVYHETGKGRVKKWYMVNTPENRALYAALQDGALSPDEVVNSHVKYRNAAKMLER